MWVSYSLLGKVAFSQKKYTYWETKREQEEQIYILPKKNFQTSDHPTPHKDNYHFT